MGMKTSDSKAGESTLNVRGDAEWAADLLETLRAGDMEVVVADLGALLVKLRKATKARRMLSTLTPEVLRQAMELTARRRRDQR